MSEPVRAGLLALSIVLLTVALAVTGGDANPFTLVYVVPVLTGALTVRSALAWPLFLLSIAGYASLFVLAPADLHHHDHEAMTRHVQGMFAGYLIAGAALVAGVVQVRKVRAEAEARLAQAVRVEERSRRLAGLATLAAGAAHELRTPLSTLLVVGHELQRSEDPQVRSDAQLICDEVDRCQVVLRDLASDAGTTTGEAFESISLRHLLEEAVSVPVQATDDAVRVPVRLVEQVVRRLVENGERAGGPVRVEGEVGERWTIRVIDQGRGMTPEELEHATEPFFSRAGGRGLGLFFARSVAEQLGGSLEIASSPGHGTTVTLSAPT